MNTEGMDIWDEAFTETPVRINPIAENFLRKRFNISRKNYIKSSELLSMPIGISSEWFAEQRKISGLTLRGVEEKTGISNSYLSQLETGKIKEPSYSTVTKLNKLYNPDYEKELENYHKWKNSSKQKSIDEEDVERYFKAYVEWKSKQQPIKSNDEIEIFLSRFALWLASDKEYEKSLQATGYIKNFIKRIESEYPKLKKPKDWKQEECAACGRSVNHCVCL